MSTYYSLRCVKCEEQGGFFSRQMWGWGNCDIFDNFKFMVAHSSCGVLEIVPEWEDRWSDDEEIGRWRERLLGDDDLRERTWPHADEWEWIKKGWKSSHERWLAKFADEVERRSKDRVE